MIIPIAALQNSVGSNYVFSVRGPIHCEVPLTPLRSRHLWIRLVSQNLAPSQYEEGGLRCQARTRSHPKRCADPEVTGPKRHQRGRQKDS